MTNDVIMTLLPKAMAKFGPSRNQTIVYHSKGIDESYPKMKLLLNFGHCFKSYWHFCQILALSTMSTHQIWSFHVTQDVNFKTFLFCPNSTFNIRKSKKIYSGKALCFSQKTSREEGGVETPPVPSVLETNDSMSREY